MTLVHRIVDQTAFPFGVDTMIVVVDRGPRSGCSVIHSKQIPIRTIDGRLNERNGNFKLGRHLVPIQFVRPWLAGEKKA